MCSASCRSWEDFLSPSEALRRVDSHRAPPQTSDVPWAGNCMQALVRYRPNNGNVNRSPGGGHARFGQSHCAVQIAAPDHRNKQSSQYACVVGQCQSHKPMQRLGGAGDAAANPGKLDDRASATLSLGDGHQCLHQRVWLGGSCERGHGVCGFAWGAVSSVVCGMTYAQ